MSVNIEVITAPGCTKCVAAQNELRAVAVDLFGEQRLHWREVNVREEFNYVIALGVLSMPAIAVNGKLIFSALPSAEQFAAALLRLDSA
jgi:hypothetical protein